MFGYDIAGRCQPGIHVGGDYYDWHPLDDTMLQITVAGRDGKGLAAGMIAPACVRRCGSRRGTTPLHEVRPPHRPGPGRTTSTSSGTFATMFTSAPPPSARPPGVRRRRARSRPAPQSGLAHRTADGARPAARRAGRQHLDQPRDAARAGRHPDRGQRRASWKRSRSRSRRCARPSSSSRPRRRADEMADRILAAAAHASLADDLTAVVVRRETS